ncbi:programmed cell death protein 2 [Gorgonomyces haynaldii]|nr:programmed cell death protein 2 [Gorgonomyces haynaldii]
MESGYAVEKSGFDQLGGLPAVLETIEAKCPHCSQELYLLLQVQTGTAYDRYLYIFGCNQLKCNYFLCKRVMRQEIKVKKTVSKQQALFSVGGWGEDESDSVSFASGSFGTPKKQEKKQERKELVIQKQKAFPCFGLEFGKTPCFSNDYTYEQQLAEKYRLENPEDANALEQTDQKPQGEWQEQYEQTPEAAKLFMRFQSMVENDPEACCLYHFGGNPYFYSRVVQPPDCDCGSKRVFEIQLLPPLLSLFKVDAQIGIQKVTVENLIDSGMDWATLIVFVCENDCHTDGITVKEEIVIAQGEFQQ